MALLSDATLVPSQKFGHEMRTRRIRHYLKDSGQFGVRSGQFAWQSRVWLKQRRLVFKLFQPMHCLYVHYWNCPDLSAPTEIVPNSNGYALRANGSIAAWGFNGANEVSNAPSGMGFTAIAAGSDSGYALRANGSIAAWGYDGFNQVSNAPSGTGFTAIAGGGYTGYALQAAPVPVPEPSTIISATIASVMGLGYGWRRRRASV
jgi:hypothetical protein